MIPFSLWYLGSAMVASCRSTVSRTRFLAGQRDLVAWVDVCSTEREAGLRRGRTYMKSPYDALALLASSHSKRPPYHDLSLGD
jgi:hypothetical protein